MPTLRAEPILTSPPGGVELSRTDIPGSTFGFGTPARAEVVWGVAELDVATDWYLDEFEQVYDLRPNTPGQWFGTRQTDGIPVRVGVTAAPTLDDVSSGSLLVEPEDVAEWSGPVVVVGASSD